MIKKVLPNSHVIWNWLIVSSSDPNAVALTVKGLVSLGVVQGVFGLLPLIGIHPSFDLNGVGDQLYSVTYGVLSAVAAIATVVGAVRKAWVYFTTSTASQ